MPTVTSSGAAGPANSDRVGFQTRAWTIPGVSARLDVNGNRPIIIHALRCAASGVRTTRGFRVSLVGNGVTSYNTLLSNKQPAPSTTQGAGHIPAVVVFTGVTDTFFSSSGNNFTMRYEAFLSGAESSAATNGALESGTTGTTDDLRVGNSGTSLAYWGGYDYYQVPTAPTSCSASFSATTATVSWVAPSSNGDTAITDYVIEYTTFPGFDAGQVFTTTAAASATSLDIGVGAYATWYFRVYARNAVGSSQRSNTASATAVAPPSWTTTSLNEVVRVGSSYTKTLSATGEYATGYSLGSGSLPAGITLSNTGVLSGTPTAGVSQAFTFRVDATGDGGTTRSNTFTLNRKQPLCVWTDNVLSTDLRVGTAYSNSVSASSAATYTAVGLPMNGISLGAGGVVSGTPTSTSTFSFTISATNSDNESISADFTFTPKAPLAVWTDNTLATATVKVGQTYVDGVAATNAVSYAIQSGALPDGIELDNVSGEISGTPTTVGTYTFTVSATNASSESIFTGSLVITVEPGGAGKVWNGATWVQAPFKVWNGAAWVEAPAKVWNGALWADPTA
jgi:hypothetical protein